MGEVESFFQHYNRLQEKSFELLGRGGPEVASRLIEQAAAAARESGPD